MGKNLVVVESPAKAKTINRILGRDYVVKYSMGHVRDLPEKKLGVDVEAGFEPKYVVVKGRKKLIDELRKTAKGCDAVYLAPDPDREGEAIAWHLKHLLEGNIDRFYRVQYNEITPRAVRKAFEHPTELDMNRVDAQQARRILDRLVGYTVSPMLWRRMRRGLSAGRVQSVALRLVCEREAQIDGFTPEPYWVFGALVRKLVVPLTPFEVKLSRINGEKAEVKSEEHALAVKGELEGRSMKVLGTDSKTVSKRPPPPFITSTLQQAASTFCGFSPRKTMTIAQKLYEGINLGQGSVGLITYMRTDSFNVSQDALEAVRGLIGKTYGDKFCPEEPNRYRSRGGAQEAHEAIRPSDVTLLPEKIASKLSKDEARLYTLIWKRFVASQMTPAKIEQRSADIEAVPKPDQRNVYVFRASASEVQFAGYMEVAGTDLPKAGEDSDRVDRLPELMEGEPLMCVEWLEERKETKPPARFSEASLIRELEKNGVGRPSTYAQTISTLHQRKYVEGGGKKLTPTELGRDVNELLVANLGDLFNVTFTADMEEKLDKVESGSVEWTSMLKEFNVQFQQWMEKTKAPDADPEQVRKVLDALGGGTEGAPPVKRGRRTYSDEKFYTSLKKQLEEGKKGVSERQFEALLKIACRCKAQTSAIEQAVRDVGREELLTEESLEPPRETSERKLVLLESLELDESAAEFVESLHAQVKGGRRLSDAQVRALDNMVVSHSALIENFDALKPELGLENVDVAEDKESGPLLEAMASVTEWSEPVKRGKRVYDDKAFLESLAGQFSRKKFLSVRQRAALKRMIVRYRAQIPEFDRLSEEFDLRKPQRRGKRSRKGESGGGESGGGE